MPARSGVGARAIHGVCTLAGVGQLSKVYFKLGPFSPWRKVFEAFCVRQQISRDRVRFYVSGEALDENDTPMTTFGYDKLSSRTDVITCQAIDHADQRAWSTAPPKRRCTPSMPKVSLPENPSCWHFA